MREHNNELFKEFCSLLSQLYCLNLKNFYGKFVRLGITNVESLNFISQIQKYLIKGKLSGVLHDFFFPELLVPWNVHPSPFLKRESLGTFRSVACLSRLTEWILVYILASIAVEARLVSYGDVLSI